ncbi:phage tail fiber C-terminal domain-containing protein [Escherichia coli]|uniref:phage tail fiber C-terminal domain-containing protein n=1 Tax=Escherichia coli TaxID=562 RepID=UPI0021BBA6AE|nr:phage tail fiber C-terminal domain-containing protein [Escherichia coli]
MVSIKNDGHYFCRAGGNRPDGLNEPVTQVVILDTDKKQIQCVVRPLQILRADGTWENIGGMK